MSQYQQHNGEFLIRKNYDPAFPVKKEIIGDSMTKQSFAEEADINTIMERFQRTGLIEHVQQYQGQYGDFSEVQDYHSSALQVIAAKEMFLTLPASLRDKFQNDAGTFLDFVNNPENAEEMAELGLLPNAKNRPKGGGGFGVFTKWRDPETFRPGARRNSTRRGGIKKPNNSVVPYPYLMSYGTTDTKGV